MSDQTDGPDPTEPAADATPAPSGDDAATPPADSTAPVVTPPPPAAADDATAAAGAATSWPTSAKVWVGILAVIALLAGIATIVGLSQASSSDDDKDIVAEERDAAINRAQSAEQERDEIAMTLEDSEATVDTLTNELATTAGELDDAQAENEVLAAAVETERSRADEAEAQLAAVGEIFPITVDTSLVGLDLAGSYTISFEEKYCDFATGCGTTPNANEAIIGVTPENFLDITIPGILQGGLFAVNGGLYAITDSETAIPPCGAVPRRGRVTITIWPSRLVVAEDGTIVPSNLEASITLDAPTINECPSGLVFWGATLTPNT
ncbi:hypothetical protein [Ilumatobacter sp.]|uniref:hypothetical protein n=1 Tax=Ilumatobacter sp. TaxID=1967498 RepID=UPI003AF4C8F5